MCILLFFKVEIFVNFKSSLATFKLIFLLNHYSMSSTIDTLVFCCNKPYKHIESQNMSIEIIEY